MGRALTNSSLFLAERAGYHGRRAQNRRPGGTEPLRIATYSRLFAWHMHHVGLLPAEAAESIAGSVIRDDQRERLAS